MKILFVLGHNRLTGVNTWAYTLAKQFVKNGHVADIEISSTDYENFYYEESFDGFYSILRSAGITYYINQNIDYNCYDAVILSYKVHTHKFTKYTGKKIYVLHGMPDRFDALYLPPEDYYVIAVNQFLMEWWNTNTFIHNGIDMDFFKPASFPITNSVPKKALCITRFVTDDVVLRALTAAEIKYDIATNLTQDKLVESIHAADFVVAYGRSCYEAMSCGKPVLVAGNHGVDGWVNKSTFPIFMYKNCNGYISRIKDKFFDNIVRLIKLGYKADSGKEMRELVEKNLTAELMYSRYLDVLENL